MSAAESTRDIARSAVKNLAVTQGAHQTPSTTKIDDRFYEMLEGIESNIRVAARNGRFYAVTQFLECPLNYAAILKLRKHLRDQGYDFDMRLEGGDLGEGVNHIFRVVQVSWSL